MRTRSSSILLAISSSNPTTSNPKRRNRRRSKQPFSLEESPVDTMADQRTMAELLRAPTEVMRRQSCSSNLDEHFELKHPKPTHAVNQQTIAMTTAMTAILKQFQATPPPASVKAVEEICVTCGGAHPYYQCLAADGNSFPEYRDNIQRYVAAATSNYNQGNSGYHPPAPIQQNQSVPLSELENFKKTNEANMKAMQTQINNVKNNGLVLDGPTVPMPPPFINPEEDERVEETLTDPEHAVILKKLPEKLGDPGKFLIPCGFSELKCKSIADLGASINLMPLSVWKKLGLPELISTQMTLELANRDICTPKGIARDVFVLVGKFIFPADFVIVDYESDPRIPLILGRPFLRTARAFIDVHGEEMILRDDLFATNHLSGNPTSSSHPDLTSPEVNDDIFDLEEDIIENLLNLDKTKDVPPYHDNPLSGNPTPISEPVTKSSSSPILTSIKESELIWEEFEAYLASDLFPPGNSNPSSPLPPFHNSLSGNTTSSSPSLPISETSDYFLEEFTDELAHITFPP
ncbi:reverse transcriptase domain-containing protein [Tanacetum coccineum]